MSPQTRQQNFPKYLSTEVRVIAVISVLGSGGRRASGIEFKSPWWEGHQEKHKDFTDKDHFQKINVVLAKEGWQGLLIIHHVSGAGVAKMKLCDLPPKPQKHFP